MREIQKLFLALIIGGGVLGFFGYQEYVLSSKSSDIPLEANLAKIENDNALESNYLKIGEHWRLYYSSIYEYDAGRFGNAEPAPTAKVYTAYYPIISNDNPFFVKLEQLGQQYNGVDNIPDEVFPVPKFKVLVKTSDFKTISAIPDTADEEEEIIGMIINDIGDGLGKEEKDLISQSFPNVNFEDILVLEQNREPTSSAIAMLMIGGGIILLIVGAGLLVRDLKKVRKNEVKQIAQEKAISADKTEEKNDDNS